MAIYWEKVLFPPFLNTIRGDFYTTMSEADLRIYLYHLACRAIAAFKFPKCSLDFNAIYTYHTEELDHTDNEVEVDPNSSEE